MEIVQSDVYLGDVISADGSNTANIKARVSKGNGILSQIRNYLETVSFGAHYFKIALLLRESLLLNGMLTNCDSWYGLSESEISDLESLDLAFFRTLFELPQTVPIVSFILETGSFSISTMIIVRIVIYLYYLLKFEDTELQSKFFYSQWENQVTSDWTTEVKRNLVELDSQQLIYLCTIANHVDKLATA